jgi:predicted transcriptional regulator
MSSTTVRISEGARRNLQELAKQECQPMQVMLEAAREQYRRRALLEEANAASAALRSDPGAWAEEQAKRAEGDAALADDQASFVHHASQPPSTGRVMPVT